MARDNSLSQLDDESHQMKGQSASIYFDDKPENSPVSDWRNEERKHRRAMLAEENRDNTAAWQIDSQEKLVTEIDKDPDEVFTMILDMRNIYTKYLNQANHADK